MQWTQLSATLVALFTLSSLLGSQVAALPTMRTYRGVSPYKALAQGGLNPLPDSEPPKFVNPRDRHPKENWDPRRKSFGTATDKLRLPTELAL